MRLTFADCVFDSGTREISRGGRVAPISPKAFRLLEVLVERRPNAVSKEQLHELLWPNTFVTDANLSNLVAELRAGLGDDPKSRASSGPCRASATRSVRRSHRGKRTRTAVGGRKLVYRLIWGNREIALGPGENLFGRDEDAIVWIDDALVSRRHARIVIDETGAVLEDLGSKNGTYLRGKRIEAPTKLANEDEVTIGPASMIFRVFKQTASTAIAVER